MRCGSLRICVCSKFLEYVSAKNWQNWMTSDYVITNIKRVTFVLRHSVYPKTERLSSVRLTKRSRSLVSQFSAKCPSLRALVSNELVVTGLWKCAAISTSHRKAENALSEEEFDHGWLWQSE